MRIKPPIVAVLVGLLMLGLTGCLAPFSSQPQPSDSQTELRRASLADTIQLLFPLRPELKEAMPMVGLDRVLSEGGTAKGVGIAIIDSFCPGASQWPCHGDFVAAIIQAIAQDAEVWELNMKEIAPGKVTIAELNSAIATVERHADEKNIKVVNISWGIPHCAAYPNWIPTMREHLDNLWKNGVTVVAAAGNEEDVWDTDYPACVDGVISVGAVYDKGPYKGLPTSYTCWGKVFAPGSWIDVKGFPQKFREGTSFASPIVAATVALLIGTAAQVGDELSPHFIHNMITETCDPFPTSRGEGCLLNAYTALDHWLDKLKPPSPPPSHPKTIEEAIDANGNEVIDDPEILTAVNYWITSQEVPGTNGKVIDDAEMLKLIQLWITGQSYK